jgi:hypothetical protein
MSTPKQPVINSVLITYIDYLITENYIEKMASFLPYTHPVNLVSVGVKRHRRIKSNQIKSKVYVRKSRTVDHLKVSIREKIAIVPQEMLVNVMQNFEERLRMWYSPLEVHD